MTLRPLSRAEVRSIDAKASEELGLPTLGSDASPLEDAGRRAIQGVSDAYFRAIADGTVDDDTHRALLDLVAMIMNTTGAGHGSLERDR